MARILLMLIGVILLFVFSIDLFVIAAGFFPSESNTHPFSYLAFRALEVLVVVVLGIKEILSDSKWLK
jgi:hypothetical protein